MATAWGLYNLLGIFVGSVVFVQEIYWTGAIDALPYAASTLLGGLVLSAAYWGTERLRM